MNTRIIKIDNYPVELSHEDKIFFPKSHISKGKIINYYTEIASKALPYYINRPATLERYPNGIQEKGFIQKVKPDYMPVWIDECNLSKRKGTIRQPLINKPATLIYLANQACITIHLSLFKVDKQHYPQYLILDLDPPSSKHIELLKFVAKRIKNLTDLLDFPLFIQTTGSKGFHLYLPLDRSSSFLEIHDFAKKLAFNIANKFPETATVEQRKEKRGERVFIDYMRNAYGQTAVAPYSVRAKEGAPVATPIMWQELDEKDLTAQRYNINNILPRLKDKGDLWAEMSKSAVSVKNINWKS